MSTIHSAPRIPVQPDVGVRRSSLLRKRHGISLVEVLVSMVLVGLLLVASMRSVGGIFQTWSTSQNLHCRMSLAQQIMAEILQQSYSDPGGGTSWGTELSESSANRSTWDDVDDYDGWSSAPQSRDGTPMAGYERWRRYVRVVYADLSNPVQMSLSDEGLKQISVTVTDPTGGETVLVAYRSRWGALEQLPEADGAFVAHVTSEIQLGSAPRLHSGAHLSNHAGDSGSP